MAMVCAAALVCVVAGCVNNSFLAPWSAAPRERWLVNEPFGTVAAVLDTGLRDNGIQLMSKHVPGEVRLAGQTKSGKVFCLYVKAAKDDREKAIVSLRWDREADAGFRRIVVELLKPPAKDAEEPSVQHKAEQGS
jgi:hypothetical protein